MTWIWIAGSIVLGVALTYVGFVWLLLSAYVPVMLAHDHADV